MKIHCIYFADALFDKNFAYIQSILFYNYFKYKNKNKNKIIMIQSIFG